MRLFKPNIKKMEQKRDIDGLIRLFSTEKDYKICNEACEALGRIGLQAECSLLMLLGHRDDNVRLYSSYAISEVYNNEKRTSSPELALTAIHQSASDSVGTVRQNAAFVLQFIGDARSIPFLIPMLDDQYVKARKNAPYALREIASRIGDQPAFQPAYQPLLHMLQSDSDEGCRQNAAWALCDLANPIAIEGLTAALKDDHQPTRINAVIGLKKIALPATLPGLVTSLRDSSAPIVKEACEALEKLDLPEAIPALEIAAKQHDRDVAQAANAALNALKLRHPYEYSMPASADAIPTSAQPSISILDNILNNPLLEWRDGQFVSMIDPSVARDLNEKHRAAKAWFRGQNFFIPLGMGEEFVAEYLYRMGLQARQAGIVQEAWGGLHEALEKYLALNNQQKIAGCCHSLGLVYGLKNDLWLANALFRQAAYLFKACETEDDEAWALTYLGKSSSDLGQKSIACEAYEMAQRIFQRTDPAQADKVAKLFAELSAEISTVAQSASSSVKPLPPNELSINAAVATRSTLICTGCRQEVETLRHICPHCGNALFWKAGTDEEAIAVLSDMKKQLEASEHVDCGGLLFLQGRYVEAELEFKKAIEINSMNATAHSNIGNIYMTKRRPKDAIPWLEKALELNPYLEGVSDALTEARKTCEMVETSVIHPSVENANAERRCEVDLPIEIKDARSVEALINELIQIGRNEGFLSLKPGDKFNADCRHTRAREIGERLNEDGGKKLMQKTSYLVTDVLGSDPGRHLEAAWNGIDNWH
jgi:HEAT repeat protein